MFWKYKWMKKKKEWNKEKIEIKSSETKIQDHFHSD
jgi:hypothetical protein